MAGKKQYLHQYNEDGSLLTAFLTREFLKQQQRMGFIQQRQKVLQSSVVESLTG